MTGGGVLNAPSWGTVADAWRLSAGRLSPAEPMHRTPIGCGAAKPSPLFLMTPTSEPAGTDGRAFEMSKSNNEKALSGTRAECGIQPLSPALIRPENEVSHRVPVLSQRKYANRKC